VSALKVCPTCGTEYPANERFCPRDGTALRAQGGSGTDLVGSIIAERYHVLKKLGEGGMGQVYLAEHVKMGRKSAVKVMNPGMVHDADAISRFNREASNASRINHPHVAGIYDFGETAEGLIYLAMEFVEGEALTDIVKSHGALPALRAARITRQAADGLQAAHDLGIVHRDLKPDNVMIGKNRDGSDCVKVVDFGIAKAAGSEAQNVTRTGMVVGTPEYMSPEQLSGDKLDGRSDVYSLALVTFHMLTGKLPFPSETVQESMIMRLTHRPQSLAETNATIHWPEAVERVMQKALERDAKLRFQSASEFGDALFVAIDSMPKQAFAEGGTLVMGAAPVPATVVSSAPASASPAAHGGTVAPPSRTPLLAGGGVLAVAALVGAVFLTKPSSPAGESTRAGGTTVAPSTGAASSPAGSVEGTGGAPAVLASRTPAVAAAGPSIDEQLAAIDRRAEVEGTAERALEEAAAIQGRLTTDGHRAYLGIIRAQAYGTLSREAQSCEELRRIVPVAKGTTYEKKLGPMLASCP
jgi:hypothetical protein